MSLTTLLDLVGVLLLIAAAALLIATWSVPAGLGAAGAGLLFVSWLIDRQARRAARARSMAEQGGVL